MIAYKSDCQFICRDQIYCLRIWFVKTGVCIGLVKIINVKVVFRWFVLYDIILPEDPPDILSEFYVFFIFDQHIDLHWLFWDEMFRIKFQIFCFVSELNLQCRIKCRMPLDLFIVGIQSYSSFYDNRMLCFFQCIGWIFCCFLHKWVCKNISQIKCSLHWIVHQNGISCRTDNEFWGHILDLISGFESADRNVVKNDHAYECFIIVTVIYLRLWCRLSIKQS